MKKAKHKNIYEGLSPRTISPLVVQTARSLIDRLDESALPTDGIYYVVRYPDKWDVFAYRFDNFPEIDHTALWCDHVAPVLARCWGRALRLSPAKLEKSLTLHAYGFPRGRVTKMGMQFRVLYGGDAPFIPNSRVEHAFDLAGAKWERDEHEQCQAEDKEAVRSLLRIKEDWKAVSSDFGF